MELFRGLDELTHDSLSDMLIEISSWGRRKKERKSLLTYLDAAAILSPLLSSDFLTKTSELLTTSTGKICKRLSCGESV